MLLAGLPGVSRVFARGEPLPAFDCHCPLLSLPLACGTRLDSVPAAPFYLSAVPDAVQVWERRMGEKTRPHIGLAWSGNSLNPTDRSRSISLSQLRSLLSPRMRFVSLQKEVRDTDRQALQDLTGIFHPHTLGDFTDTARLIATLDLVITVDTSIAHLAGAMGKPVWILLAYGADWRWLLHREDSPWYPSARLFRQTGIGQWDSVLGKVARELEARF